jgi:hypothetical protein
MKHLSSSLIALVLTLGCGEEAVTEAPVAPPAAPAPPVAEPAAAPAPVAAPAVPTTPATILPGTWDLHLRGTMMPLEIDATTLRITMPDGSVQTSTYAIVENEGALSLHMVDADGEVSDEPLRLYGADAGTLGAGPRRMEIVRHGIDRSSDPRAQAILGRWRWAGAITTYAPDGVLINDSGTRETRGGYQVVDVSDEGVLILHWLVVLDTVRAARNLGRLQVNGDVLTFTDLPSDDTRELVRVVSATPPAP